MGGDHQVTVRKIIAENQYMTLATSDGDRPWGAPVQFCCDENLDSYLVSLPTSLHAQHIAENPTVAMAIFDSRQPPFTGRGLQVDGIAAVYSEQENPFATVGGLDMPVDLQALVPGYVAYKVQAQRFYVPRAHLEGVLRDERVEVQMT